MNIGIIADIHGNYTALQFVVDDMKKNNIDSVIVLGDILFSGNEPQKCFDLIQELKPIVWIRGNTDDWLYEINDKFNPQNEKENIIYKKFLDTNSKISMDVGSKLKKLKEKEEIEIEGKRILCVHGSDRKINEAIGIIMPQEEIIQIVKRLKQDILLCAHTHLPYIVSLDGKLIMNVGSVGLPIDEKRASYGILRFEKNNFEYSIRRIEVN